MIAFNHNLDTQILLFGNHNSHADFNYSTKLGYLETNAKYYDIESYNVNYQELIIKPLYSYQDIFISICSFTDIININFALKTYSYRTSPHCLRNCSGNGVCINDSCICREFYSGDSCSIFYKKLNWETIIENLHPYQYHFYLVALVNDTNRTGLHIQLNTNEEIFAFVLYKNDYLSVPSFFSFDQQVKLLPTDNIITNKSASVEYILISIFCFQNVSCNYNITNEILSSKKGYRIIILAMIATASIITAFGIPLLIYFKCRRREDFIENNNLQISSAEMDILCPGKHMEKISSEDVCPICFDNFSTEDVVRVIRCSHIFHKHCIDVWVSINGICPVCKLKIKA